MASLPHPGKCTNCDSDFLLHERHPERYVCHDCGAIVISRGIKPATGICRYCDAKKSDGVPFSNHSNVCIECKSKYNKQYRIDNRDKILQQHRESYQRDKVKRRAASRNAVQRSPEAFITYLIRVHTRVHAVNFKETRTRGGNPIPAVRLAILRTVTITKEYMLDLYWQQDGICALTGLKMTHQIGDMLCMSIDRKDSNIGYIPSNVQFVCQFANKAKGMHPNEEALAVFRAIRELGVSSGPNSDAIIC